MPVSMEVINEKEYVLIEKTGSSSENHINNSTFAVQSYSNTLYNAAELNERVKEVMREIVELPEVTKCVINSDYNFTDTTTKEYRYQAVIELTHY